VSLREEQSSNAVERRRQQSQQQFRVAVDASSSGIDALKAEAFKQGRWRLGEDGYIEKGPFPKEKSTVNVSLIRNISGNR